MFMLHELRGHFPEHATFGRTGLVGALGPVRYQIASGDESGTAGAAGAESSRCFLPYVAMMKTTNPR